jgi:hypothetical protein
MHGLVTINRTTVGEKTKQWIKRLKKRKEKDLSRSIILAIEIFEIALTQIYELLV